MSKNLAQWQRTAYQLVAAGCTQLGLFTCVQGSDISTSVKGINSAILPLTGDGIGVGYVDITRPGLPNYDMPANSNPDVVPAKVFVGKVEQTPPVVADQRINLHAENVAGVIISSDKTDSITTPNNDFPVGVAPNAQLFAAGIATTTAFPHRTEFAEAVQTIATSNGDNMRAVNMSFGIPLVTGAILDGNSLLTQVIDWSATKHNTLYVVAGNENFGVPIPTDNFNGMTVASSSPDSSGVYRHVDQVNTFNFEDAVGDRTSTDILSRMRLGIARPLTFSRPATISK